jgi:FtsZ-binding cell division protein ZapB
MGGRDLNDRHIVKWSERVIAHTSSLQSSIASLQRDVSECRGEIEQLRGEIEQLRQEHRESAPIWDRLRIFLGL